jgi:hypothetical protein
MANASVYAMLLIAIVLEVIGTTAHCQARLMSGHRSARTP